MAIGLYATRAVEIAYERRGPVTRGKLYKVGRMGLRARCQTINLYLYFITIVKSDPLLNEMSNRIMILLNLKPTSHFCGRVKEYSKVKTEVREWLEFLAETCFKEVSSICWWLMLLSRRYLIICWKLRLLLISVVHFEFRKHGINQNTNHQ